MSHDAFEYCMGPPCKHFPPGTTPEEAREILAYRALSSSAVAHYLSVKIPADSRFAFPIKDDKP